MKFQMDDRFSLGYLIRVCQRRLVFWCRLGGCCTLLLITMLNSDAQARDEVGFVLKMSGHWVLERPSMPPQRITERQSIPPESKLRPESPGATVTILLIDDTKIDCSSSNLGRCSEPFNLSSPSPGKRERITKAVMLLFEKQPTRYDRPALVRGREVNLQDSVVRLQDGKMDLSPVFRNAEKHAYRLQVWQIGPGTKSDGAPTEVLLRWNPGTTTFVSAKGIKSGLHEINVVNEGTKEPLAGVAWILVSTPEQYNKNVTAFQEAVALTQHWGKEVGRDSVQSFLRAYLDALAER